jgi:hypothetical protein
VRDPDFFKTDSIEIYIEPREDITPPPPPDPTDEPPSINWVLIVGIIAVLGILGAVLFVVAGKRKTEEYEERMDTEMKEDAKRESMKRAHEAIKDLADEWETEREWEEDTDDFEEIEVEADSVPSTQLSMEAKVTEAASAETQRLFTPPVATEKTDAEKEALWTDTLKRKYQNAIGRLPYGIPSKELADMDWVDLANALAEGEKRMTPDGREITAVKGRWYYSDVKDTGTFLKEHGAKPKAETPKRAPPVTTDKAGLLAKLEERFILGEISEETYKDLKKKFEG